MLQPCFAIVIVALVVIAAIVSTHVRNKALRGAFERIPTTAVTVGFKQIFSSRQVRVYFNRPWQCAVVRKLLFGEITSRFPASLLRDHPDTRLVMTREVARRPEFQLK